MRLFIADADSTFRLAVQMYLQQEPGMYVTGIATETQGLSDQIEASHPDVLLLDWHLPGAPIQDCLSDVLGLEHPPKVIVLSVKAEDKSPALSAGADAFIAKNVLPAKLAEEIHFLNATTYRRSR